MGFYDTDENVDTYMKMAEGFDGKALIAILKTYLPRGSSVLELGMGSGIDLDILAKDYDVTGSDNSDIFLERYSATYPDVKLGKLDITNLPADNTYDCIYSNKVLHHLTLDELRLSLTQQVEMLKANGLLFHTFWAGKGSEEMHGMRFTYHLVESLTEIIGDTFKIETIQTYTEMEDADSLYVILRKDSNA
ncbi:MAG: class I SAM-dependent methyltransferase [Ghiorsea sp.]